MQTFLPYPDFTESAYSLDYKRLGKQRVETKQILNALDGLSAGWTNHPATKMWQGHRGALAQYGVIICQEWRSRGYKDSLLPEFIDRSLGYLETCPDEFTLPNFIGDEQFHLSHQSNLIRKNPIFYIPVFGDIPDDLPYVWYDPQTIGE
jgi:hypothetical protein